MRDEGGCGEEVVWRDDGGGGKGRRDGGDLGCMGWRLMPTLSCVSCVSLHLGGFKRSNLLLGATLL